MEAKIKVRYGIVELQVTAQVWQTCSGACSVIRSVGTPVTPGPAIYLITTWPVPLLRV